mmetsp:Transcript_5430/g.8326  ORF Transcript_5430/g.8326 Transcript_5430/m.8326 type:complete len:239 (-) Transcript_5430:249-965(-)
MNHNKSILAVTTFTLVLWALTLQAGTASFQRPIVKRTTSSHPPPPPYHHHRKTSGTFPLGAAFYPDYVYDSNDVNRGALPSPNKQVATTHPPTAAHPPAPKKLSTRKRLAKMGLATLLSYGVVQNIKACITMGISWFAFSKRTNLSPLAPHQWKPFLTVYAGFHVATNVIDKPLCIALSIGLGPHLESFVGWIRTRAKVSKSVAVGITAVLFNVVLTLMLMALSVLTASVLSGVPLLS